MSTSRRSRSLAASLVSVTFVLLSQATALGPSSAAPRLRPAQNPAPAPPPQLDALLAKAAEYCRKLESASFDFACREEIAESVNPSLDAGPGSPPPKPGGAPYPGPTISIGWTNKIKRRFVYDYQCTRAGGVIRETRTLLEENGKKRIVPNAELATPAVDFGAALLGPVGLFGERFQPGYDYTVAGEEKLGQARVLVVDAKPKPGAPPGPNLYGKAWVDPETGDILKIERSEGRAGRFDVFEKRGQIYKRKPRLVIRSEFSAEKNGLRFPGLLSVEEAYLNDAGKAAVRSRTEVIYRDFKFFTVDFEVRDRAGRG